MWCIGTESTKAVVIKKKTKITDCQHESYYDVKRMSRNPNGCSEDWELEKTAKL